MKALKSVFAVLILLLVATAKAYAQQYPKPTGFVNDFVNLLTYEQGASLNDELVAFEKKTEIEIVVVTVSWLNNQSIEDYTRGLATEWGVGKRGQNNGVVFLIAPKERKMRIETAEGVRSILTDNRADGIRDAILPRFRSGNMAQGIIEGTHAIMRTLDPNVPFSTGEEMTQTPQSTPKEWTPKDTEILSYLLGTTAGAGLLLLLIVPPIQRSKARKYVLENRGKVAVRFRDAEQTARHADVKEETRKKLAELKSDFSEIDRLTATSTGVKWIATREKLDSMDYPLSLVVSYMNREIAFAEEARREGPELMKKLPDIIAAAEGKLAEDRQSRRAAKYLEEARARYAQAQAQVSGMASIDWVILYAILISALSEVEHAESAHASANSRFEHLGSHSRPSDSTSYGFGNTGGLGGGGGFSGSGSSGSW